ncbi:acyltransferase [Streptomyces sp. KS 21]|uniref:acyltransferase family protein n=1 Tax=Streptomyces sp. KS 21 TaxID=2485150 RepID=UPI00106421CD|nr:acyltransferase [Streptomyces sp. KS 21]TDU75528.1 peptidoglycan/LPS O-acetylase OafA/YrhL [Streptomyces sp. KS 21]
MLTADPDAASATSSSPQRRAPLPSLTGLRFVAAMLVFLTHSTMLSNVLSPMQPVNFFADPDIAKPLADFCEKAGAIGVSFFFVLSGFVLTWSATPGDRVTSFWRRRALKIYPNHIVTWVLAMVLFTAATPMHAWLPNLFLVHTFSNDPVVFGALNPVAWSLCSELLFYALFPLLIIPVRRIAERRLWLWAGGMVAGVIGVAAVTKYVRGGLDLGYELTLNQFWFSYSFPPPRLFEFVLGMILARIVAANLWPRIGLLTSAALFAGGYWLANNVPAPYFFSACTIVPVAMIICAGASRDLRGAGGWLTSRTMLWLGNISFAFYIVHGVVIFWGRSELLGGRTFDFVPAVGLQIALLLANVLAAWLLYSLVEQPVMRRWSRSKKEKQAVEQQAPQDAREKTAQNRPLVSDSVLVGEAG